MKKSLTTLSLMLILVCFFSATHAFGQSITNLSNLNYTEGNGYVLIDSDISITGGTNYGEGYLQFSLTGGSSGDSFGTTNDADVNAAGAISFDSGIVYLGNGSGRDPVGNIDPTLNGQNGADLRINFTSNFENGSFETQNLDGWTFMNQFIDLGSTSIAGWPSPNDTRDNDAPASANYWTTIETDQKTAGTYSVRLRSSMTTAGGCDYVHGPALYSDVFQAAAGDILKFDWRAFQGSDAYSVYVYLLNDNTGATHTILNQTSGGSTNWETGQIAVPSTDSYRFVFVCGTWDETCGRAAGASLYVDNVVVSGSRVVDAVITNIARKITYQWDCGTSSDRTLTVSAKNTTGTTFSANSTISITLGPDLVVGSISEDQTICYNTAPAEIEGVAPTGGIPPYDYQWEVSTDGTNYSDISGATSLDYQPGALTQTTYYRLIQGSTGCEEETTNVVTVTVRADFDPGAIETTGETICYGGDPSEIGSSSAASGGDENITYAWVSSLDATFTSPTVIPSSNSATYDPPTNLTVTTWYARTAFDGTCNTSPETATGTWKVTVRDDFTPGEIETTGETICYDGDPSTIGSVTAASGGDETITYAWVYSLDEAFTTPVVIPSSNSATYDPPANLTTTTWYARTAFDGTCNTTPEVATGTWKVTVLADFTAGSISADQLVCGGETPALLEGVAPTGGDTPYSYQWQSSTDNVTFSDISGADELDYQPGTISQATYYRLVQTSASGCGEEVTNTVTIDFYPALVEGSISDDQELCYNSTPEELIGVAPTGGSGVYTYQWQMSTDDVTYTNITGATNLNYQPGALTETTYYQLVQTSGSCGDVVTNKVTITVYPLFEVGSISDDQNICYNTAPAELIGVAPTGADGNYAYQWQISTDNVSYTDITGANSINYQPAALTATTYYQLIQTSTYGCGEETTNSVMVEVYPMFVVGSISGTQTICYDTQPEELLGVAPTGADGDYTYQWEYSTDGTNFSEVSGATGIDYQPGNLTTTTHYRQVQTSAYGCGVEITNQVTVNVYDFVPAPELIEKKRAGHVSILAVDNSEYRYENYLWTYGDGSPLPNDLIDDRQFLTLPLAHMDATYMVFGIDDNGCAVSSMAKTVTPTQMLSSVYPTISRSNFNLDIAGPENGIATVRIFNELGHIVETLEVDKNSTTRSVSINVSSYNKGTYMVEVSINGYREVHRVFVR